jgi:hypothetical protein
MLPHVASFIIDVMLSTTSRDNNYEYILAGLGKPPSSDSVQ